MFTTVAEFTAAWKAEMEKAEKLFDALSDDSLNQPQHDDIRTLGRVAWHVVTTLPEMCNRFGFKLEGPTEKDPIPSKVSDIKQAYMSNAKKLLNQLDGWSDADLRIEDDMYGETWKRGNSLYIFLIHEIHHLGQMTIMMRMAGLPVPGLYGPSREEWKTIYKMDEPAV